MNFFNGQTFKNYFSSRNRSLTKDQQLILELYQEKISIESFFKLEKLNDFNLKSLEIGFGTGEKILQGLYKSFVLLAVPLFIAAANIMNGGTITDRLLKFCIAIVGRFKGGLGHVNVVASLIFSGMSGSAVADAAGIGKIIIGMMTKSGRYTKGYAAAITAASATIGPIIPPRNYWADRS